MERPLRNGMTNRLTSACLLSTGVKLSLNCYGTVFGGLQLEGAGHCGRQTPGFAKYQGLTLLCHLV